MKFLSKLAQVLKGAITDIPIIGGLISAFIPQAKAGQTAKVIATVTNDLSVLAGVIANVEAISAVSAQALTGAQKLQLATPLVAKAILSTALLANHKVDNDALFTAGAQKIADGLADVLNSLHADGVQTQSAA